MSVEHRLAKPLKASGGQGCEKRVLVLEVPIRSPGGDPELAAELPKREARRAVFLELHLDNLWIAREEAPTEGLDAPAYAEQGLGALWNTHEKAKTSGGVIGSYAHRSLGNLWNSAL